MPRLPSLFRLPSKLARRRRRSRASTMILLLAVLLLVLTPLFFIYRPPLFLINYFQQRWPDVLFSVPVSSKIVALTIDDGPSQYTREIMELLKENNAAATFFIIGSRVAGQEPVVRELIRNGNELGNHAMYDEPSKSLADEVLADQIVKVQKKLHAAYHVVGVEPPPNYFRPGSGLFSDRMRKLVASLDYQLVLGSIYPHDPQIPYWKFNVRHVLSRLHPGGIIICHDGRSWTLPMLQKVLPEIKRRGYRIVTVTELLNEGKKKSKILEG